jgi:NADH-quinone oxidoreductase chain G
MIKIEIDGIEFLVKSGISILEACEFVGIDVPRFCYHQVLSVAGNCRMCLIEIFNSPKPVASCALTISNNMKIFTDTPLVKKARENVLEILLLNHPLDCPICDQGGECDLQDQSKAFGIETSRYFFNKRVTEDKNCGPVIKTIMTRCIHCTRCVRFNSEISGKDFFGTLNRGSSTEIGSYINSFYDSTISANVIDLCPVGALTSKEYAFKSRPWELRTNETIDITDGLGSSIYVSSKESDIVRIFPKANNEINERFISDKARFFYDSNKINRVKDLYSNIRIEKKERKDFIKSFLSLKKNKSTFLINDSLDLDSIFYVKNLENINNSEKKNKSISLKSINKAHTFYSNFYISWLNNSLSDINFSQKFCFIVSSNLQIENSILNVKIRFKTLNSNFSCFGFITNSSKDFDLKVLNINFFHFVKIFEAKSLLTSKLFIKYKNPLFIIGESIFKRGVDFNFFYLFIKKVAPTASLIKVQNTANAEGSLFFNVSPITRRVLNKTKFLFCLDIEDSLAFKKYLSKDTVILFFSTHNSDFINKKNVFFLFPWSTHFEKTKVFINLEQRFQKTNQISHFNFNNIEWSDKNLIKFLFGFDFIYYKYHLNFAKELISNQNLYGKIKNMFFFNNNIYKEHFYSKYLNSSKKISNYPFKNLIEDFYLSNKMLKNSKIMQKCSQFYRKNIKARF